MSPQNVIPFPAGAPVLALDEREDDELMRLAHAGRRDAFEVLVARHMPKLASFCIKMLGDRRTGEDVAQEAWLQVWSHRATYKPQGKFAPFLYTIARNRCRNAMRSSRRRSRVQSDLYAADTEADPDQPSHLDALLAVERRKRVVEAMTTLPAKHREALLLRFAQELDYAQIAEIVGCPESTARSRVHHGLRKLRHTLGEDKP